MPSAFVIVPAPLLALLFIACGNGDDPNGDGQGRNGRGPPGAGDAGPDIMLLRTSSGFRCEVHPQTDVPAASVRKIELLGADGRVLATAEKAPLVIELPSDLDGPLTARLTTDAGTHSSTIEP